jgi:hypothetical protein
MSIVPSYITTISSPLAQQCLTIIYGVNKQGCEDNRLPNALFKFGHNYTKMELHGTLFILGCDKYVNVYLGTNTFLVSLTLEVWCRIFD